MTAIGLHDDNGDIDFVFQVDGKASGVNAKGTVVQVSNELVEVPMPVVREFEYQPKKEREDDKLNQTTPLKAGTKFSRTEFFDTDPDRCVRYFSVKPGQRIDGRATVIGMQIHRNRVNLFAHVDDASGAGTYEAGTSLFVEEGVLYPTEPFGFFEDDTLMGNFAEPNNPENEEVGMEYEETTSFSYGSCMQTPVEAKAFQNPAEEGGFPESGLTRASRDALNNVNTRATEQHRSTVEERLRKAGFEKAEQTLDAMVRFLSHESPIITWFKPFKVVTNGVPQIECMTNDCCLRNQFEVFHSNGLMKTEARERWERDLFGGAYETCPATERPKYGLFNIFGDPEGPKVPRDQYGDCFLVFTEDVRKRTTMTPFDSSGVSTGKCYVCSVTEGTSACFSQFKENGKELETFAQVASGSKCYAKSEASYYKEAQIHMGKKEEDEGDTMKKLMTALSGKGGAADEEKLKRALALAQELKKEKGGEECCIQ